MSAYKLGRLPATRPAVLKDLAVYAQGALPTPPAAVASPPGEYPIDGNATYGDAVLEGTTVGAPRARRAYRVRYSGPAIRIKFGSGRVLAVTPNHAVLTPRGFIRAKFLKEGDEAVSARGGELLAATDRNHPPALIEEIHSAFLGCATRSRATKIRPMVEAVDFHGDGRFADGNVDVIDTHGELDNVSDSALGQPVGKAQLGSARVMSGPLHRRGFAFQRYNARGTAALRGMGARGAAFALGGSDLGRMGRRRFGAIPDRKSRLLDRPSHPRLVDMGLPSQGGVALASNVATNERCEVRLRPLGPESQRLSGSSLPVASRSHPSSEGHTTDPELAADLIQRFPGLVATDRIIDIEVFTFAGHVYDLSTDSRWYAANDIVTHNCTIAGADHIVRAWRALYGDYGVLPTEEELVAKYLELSPNDEGLVEASLLQLWRTEGLGLFGGKIKAYAPVPPKDILQIHQAIAFYGAAYLGIICGAPQQEQFSRGEPWSWVDGQEEDGHCVVATGYTSTGLLCKTWGGEAELTYGYLAHALEECWCIIGYQLAEAKKDDLGLDLAALEADLAKV